MIEYKGYIARLDIDEEKDGFHGRVINVSDVINFKGKSMAELKREFRKSMESYFKLCEEDGHEPDKPFSGKFVLRVAPSVHRAITLAADREGVSINKWAEHQLEIAAQAGKLSMEETVRQTVAAQGSQSEWDDAINGGLPEVPSEADAAPMPIRRHKNSK